MYISTNRAITYTNCWIVQITTNLWTFLAWPLACHICFARILAKYLHNIFLSIIFVAAAADASSAVSLQPQNCKAHLRKGYGVEYILYIFIYLFIYLLNNNLKVPSSLIFCCSHFLLLLTTLGAWVWRSFVKKFDNDDWKNDWSWENCSSWGQHIVFMWYWFSSRKHLDRLDNLFITARLKKRSYLDIHWRLLLTLIVISFTLLFCLWLQNCSFPSWWFCCCQAGFFRCFTTWQWVGE